MNALFSDAAAETVSVGFASSPVAGASDSPPQPAASSVIAAAAPVCGMTDLVLDYHTTRPDLRPYREEMIGGTPEQIPDRYKERSPINFIDAIKGHLLIVQGLQDPNVTPDNVRMVVERLDAAHVPYELLQFGDEGHGISKPVNQKKLYRRLVDFFDAALGPRG